MSIDQLEFQPRRDHIANVNTQGDAAHEGIQQSWRWLAPSEANTVACVGAGRWLARLCPPLPSCRQGLALQTCLGWMPTAPVMMRVRDGSHWRGNQLGHFPRSMLPLDIRALPLDADWLRTYSASTKRALSNTRTGGNLMYTYVCTNSNLHNNKGNRS